MKNYDHWILYNQHNMTKVLRVQSQMSSENRIMGKNSVIQILCFLGKPGGNLNGKCCSLRFLKMFKRSMNVYEEKEMKSNWVGLAREKERKKENHINSSELNRA